MGQKKTDSPGEALPKRVFTLRTPKPRTLAERLLATAASPLERMLGLKRLDRVYADCANAPDPLAFMKTALESLNVSYSVLQEDLERIPKKGPVVVVANHPFGALEGIILAVVLRTVRPDSKMMANFILSRMPQLRELFLYVDPFDREGSAANNIGPLRESMRWLQQGHLLGVFPAGEVAHLHLRQLEVTDPPWSHTISRIVQRARVPVVPIFFRGGNSALFQVLGLVHPSLRTVMLPRELLRKRHTTVEVRVGSLIPARRLGAFEKVEDITAFVRHRTFMLQHRGRKPSSASTAAAQVQNLQPIVEATPIDAMAREIDSLPASYMLLEADDMRVYHVRAGQAPLVLRELGRLRELTFRATGEGTGKPIDIDPFDDTYVHLFVWNVRQQHIVGAYRLGLTDEILPRSGKTGLYTSTLFDYKPGLLEQINPAIELGRSFVRCEYQKSYTPLLLLWKGIGRFISSQPRYKTLFGPVSISNTYLTVSRQLMVEFLRSHNNLPALARFVEARNPFRVRRNLRGCEKPMVQSLLKDSDDVSDLIADLEGDQKGLPVLIRHYLKLNAKMLAFNLDPEFSDVVDALMLVDLRTTDRKLLDRYMGKEAAQAFLKYHEGR